MALSSTFSKGCCEIDLLRDSRTDSRLFVAVIRLWEVSCRWTPRAFVRPNGGRTYDAPLPFLCEDNLGPFLAILIYANAYDVTPVEICLAELAPG